MDYLHLSKTILMEITTYPDAVRYQSEFQMSVGPNRKEAPFLFWQQLGYLLKFQKFLSLGHRNMH